MRGSKLDEAEASQLTEARMLTLQPTVILIMKTELQYKENETGSKTGEGDINCKSSSQAHCIPPFMTRTIALDTTLSRATSYRSPSSLPLSDTYGLMTSVTGLPILDPSGNA
jgi:hypothetical protein